MAKTSTPEITEIPSLSGEKQKAETPEKQVPRQHVIRNILSFSRSLEVKETEMAGKVMLTGN